MKQDPVAATQSVLGDQEPKRCTPKRVQLHELMGSDTEIVIEHAGCAYRLRITRQNKLILTK